LFGCNFAFGQRRGCCDSPSSTAIPICSPNHVKKSTVDLVLPPFPHDQGSPIRAGPPQPLPVFQQTLFDKLDFDQLDFDRISSIASRAPLVESSRGSYHETDFFRRLQNAGDKILINKPGIFAIASKTACVGDRSGELQSEI
jgi:hypothetical protein